MTTNKGPRLIKMLAGKLKRAEHERNVFRIRTSEGETLEDVLKMEYWTHVGKTLRAFDIIEVVFHDGRRYVELLVIDSAPLWAKTVVLRDLNLDKEVDAAAESRTKADDDAPYYVKFISPTLRFGIIRRSDGERIKDGFAEKKDAEAYLTEWLKAQAA